MEWTEEMKDKCVSSVNGYEFLVDFVEIALGLPF